MRKGSYKYLIEQKESRMSTNAFATTRQPPVSTDDRRRALESSLLRLENVRLDSVRSHKEEDVYHIRSFPAWLTFARSLNDPDEIRNGLYFGFQPLYDGLVAGGVDGHIRSSGLRALRGIVDTGRQFLTSYYMGQPDVTLFQNGVERIAQNLLVLGDNIQYATKYRNIDDNHIHPRDILNFLKKFLQYAIDKKIKIPDYVVGSACGASEIAMPLAGILGTDIGFLRMSRHRYDGSVVKVVEDGPEIRQRSNGKNVACIEDYVCTGYSLRGIMDVVKGYRPASVIGASIEYSNENRYLKTLVGTHKFHLFELGRSPW
jgi:adenine/guanine phosphoribosyltransferase-like PRPP-binding protein